MTAQGNQYDLKDPIQRYLGIAEMIGEKEDDEPEVFTSSREDEMELFGYLYSVDRKTA